MKIQSSHTHSDRGLDPYFTPPEATLSLIAIENLPKVIWEPAAGDGAISKVLIAADYVVFSSDIARYGDELSMNQNFSINQIDYFKCTTPFSVGAIITNPPFLRAVEFAQKALTEVPYLALLLRTNFLESISRLPFFRASPPSRVWISSRRLPMMHRFGWTGPTAPSNTCHAWFIWDHRQMESGEIGGFGAPKLCWFDWADHAPSSLSSTSSISELGL